MQSSHAAQNKGPKEACWCSQRGNTLHRDPKRDGGEQEHAAEGPLLFLKSGSLQGDWDKH